MNPKIKMDKSSTPSEQTDTSCGCDEKRQKTLNNLLRDSAFRGHIINVKKWIKAGAQIDVNEQNDEEIIDVDNLLLNEDENNPPINIGNRKIFTALHSAIMGSMLDGKVSQKILKIKL